MKILFLGLGSIGQRHLINAKKIFPRSRYYALRIKKKNLIIQETNLIKKTSIEKYYKVNILKNYNEAINLKPDLTFICNPSSQHLDDAIRFAKVGSNLFIEKPLGDSKVMTKKLIHIVKKKKIITMIGFQSRFHPFVKHIKKIIKKKKFGKLIYGDFRFMTYLPNHHKYENFKNSYAALRKLGGGVISSLVHEIDLISFFFGQPKKVYSNTSNSKSIQIEAEDNFCSLMNFNNKLNNFNVFLRLSFTQAREERFFKILFEKVYITCDLMKNEMKFFSNKKNILIKKYKVNIKRNDLFYKEIQELKMCINLNKNPRTSLFNTLPSQKLLWNLKGL